MHPNVVLNYTRSDGVSVQASDRAIRWVSKALGPLQSIDFRTTRKWGFSVSTFALRSNESLGIGDLDDLRKCMDTLGHGCGVLHNQPVRALVITKSVRTLPLCSGQSYTDRSCARVNGIGWNYLDGASAK